MTAGVRDKPARGSGICTELEQKERKDFVSLGCGTHLNRVEYSSTVQYRSNNILRTTIVSQSSKKKFPPDWGMLRRSRRVLV